VRALVSSSLLVVFVSSIAVGCAPKVPSPAPDIDGDGVPDAVDRCPGKREDGLDPEPRDGCPASLPGSDA
jgi:hypothetical protein